MLHHERLRPPHDDYTPDEWNLVEKAFHPEFVAQTESLFALSNGYLGMRGVPEEGEPAVQNGTFINGFYEEWPIVYSEAAYGFARTGQTMLNVTDSKIIRLFVDDEPFGVAGTNIRHYDRRLNLKAGTLDRELHWETPSGKLVRIRTRRLVSFRHHLASESELLRRSALRPRLALALARRGERTLHFPVFYFEGVASGSVQGHLSLPLPPLHQLPFDKEHPLQPAFTERLAEDTESEKRNEHQQHDEVAGERFLQPWAKEITERGGNRLVVEQADDYETVDYHVYRSVQGFGPAGARVSRLPVLHNRQLESNSPRRR